MLDTVYNYWLISFSTDVAVGGLVLTFSGEESTSSNDADSSERSTNVHVGSVRVVFGGLHQGQLLNIIGRDLELANDGFNEPI